MIRQAILYDIVIGNAKKKFEAMDEREKAVNGTTLCFPECEVDGGSNLLAT
ncbi:hypothetical protein [Intestinimonas butyriciproducens]|uniref:hypothetical protein n=1 Tax=Intestinimonas butyriciproducens TaxID=1297617 RepID=UPI00101ABC67|nr:hypothetical protein [Intestinimonas butyriciproducens]QBB66953.1 hypothetical protein SRB521_02695 [Intestinimonas butyriciproducens]